MKKLALALFALPLLAGATAPPPPSPNEIVAAAPASDWVAIAPADLMVMDLAPKQNDASTGSARRVVIQLMPPPFSQGWISNIRKLVAARWYDGVSVNRVQDNYVVQWGDPNGEDPKKARALPDGIPLLLRSDYSVDGDIFEAVRSDLEPHSTAEDTMRYAIEALEAVQELSKGNEDGESQADNSIRDPYAMMNLWFVGWPIVGIFHEDRSDYWPVHCYGMVGVGRNMPPDTGNGAELYTVIGHAPRHLDRNIALVGRVIEGIEHLSSLPRGTEALGFYKTPDERVPILSVRMGNEVEGLPAFQYLSTEGKSFAAYADARANRRDAFFIRPAGGADICNIPVPVRRVP